jgi:hypothetical protein
MHISHYETKEVLRKAACFMANMMISAAALISMYINETNENKDRLTLGQVASFQLAW